MVKSTKDFSITGEINVPLTIKKFADEYVFEIEAPSQVRENIGASVVNGELVVQVVSEDTESNEDCVVVSSTRKDNYSDFSVKLPEDANVGSVTALQNDGILVLAVGRMPEPAPVYIKIKRPSRSLWG